MIKINNFIFNENEIFNINTNGKGNVITIVFKDNKRPSLNMFATFEDIEWNYDTDMYCKVMTKIQNRNTKPEEENKELKDKVLELSNHITLYSSEETMLKEINNLKLKINEAIEYIEHNDIMKVSKEEETKGDIFCCDIELLKILKGEENESN